MTQKDLKMLYSKIVQDFIKTFVQNKLSDEEVIYILTRISSSWTLDYINNKIRGENDD